MDSNRQDRGFGDYKIGGKPVRVPAKKDASLNGLDVHVRASDGGSVIRDVFDDFFVETVILLPASDGVELAEMKGKARHKEVGLNPGTRESILFLLPKLFTDEKLEEPRFRIHESPALV